MPDYWDRKDWGEVLDKHVKKMKERFPPPAHGAKFFLRVSKTPLKDYPFRIRYEGEEDEDDEEEEE